MNPIALLLITLILALPAPLPATSLQPASIFTDHLILQRDQPVPIWGRAPASATVTVHFAGQTRATRADAAGHWRVELPPLPASAEPRDLTITAGNDTVTLRDVLVGEVWLASGQSNMAWPLADTTGGADAVANAADPLLRLFQVARRFADQPQSSLTGQWTPCAPDTVKNFSAVAYYFARDLRRQLGLPVGVINSSWGGTPAQAWTARETLLADDRLAGIVHRHDEQVRRYDPAKAEADYRAALEQHRVAVEKAKAAGQPAPKPPAPPQPPGNQNSPGYLYNAMIAPLVPFAIRGVIWYQGEANANDPATYRVLLPAMIANWRRDFGHNFPFLFVQIAPYRGQPPEIRDAQLHAWRTVTNTAMIVITDHGDPQDIHPRRKEPVGARLALAARALAYGESIVYSGPLFESVRFDGPRALLTFQHTGGGLVAGSDTLSGFTISADGKNFVPATATISGNTVIATSDRVAAPVAVRYGWANVPEGNLFNREGLPASPFRTDSTP